MFLVRIDDYGDLWVYEFFIAKSSFGFKTQYPNLIVLRIDVLDGGSGSCRSKTHERVRSANPNKMTVNNLLVKQDLRKYIVVFVKNL